jgi:hypothetical protein
MKNSATDIKMAIASAARDAVKMIASASLDAAKTLASAAFDARSVVAANASEAAKVLSEKNSDGGSDHDLLTQLNVKVDRLKDDIKEIKDGTTFKIAGLEIGKLDNKDSYAVLYKKCVEDKFTDHEARLRDSEVKINRVMAYGSVVVFAVGLADLLINKFYK